MDKKLIGFMALMIFALLLFGCTQTTTNESAEEGRLVIAITDAAANLESVQKIDVTIESIKVLSDVNGWVTINMNPTTVDLLDLNASNTTILLADVNVPAGNYSQIELEVSNVTIVDANGTSTAKVPSNRFKVISNTKVDTNTATALTFDVLASESLHVTGNGKYIFSPVVNLTTTTNAKLEISANNQIRVTAGNKKENKFGMNVGGEVAVGGGISIDTDLGIDSEGNIVLPVDVGGGIGNGNQNGNNPNTDVNLDVNVGIGIGIN